MIQNVLASFNMINFIFSSLAWGVVVFLVVRHYQRCPEKPRVWKMLLVLFLGLFTFSIDWHGMGTKFKIPLLPLGVWILFLIFRVKKTSWQRYRPFAWMGFFANFIFLVSALLAVPIQNLIYPLDQPTTYLSNVEDASIIVTHPSGKKSVLDKKSTLRQLSSMKEKAVFSEQWYSETYENNDSHHMKERFPYLLIGGKSKWGSGPSSVIYIEKDGKGLLISTLKRQYYFRSMDSLIKKGGE